MSATSFKYFDEESRTGRARYSQFGTSSNSRSFEIESWSYIKHGDYNLQVMQKIETKSQRTIIPASFWERMAFYRSYTSSAYKTHINCMQDIDLKLYVWNYILNVILKALPSIYTQMFLANYATDEHMYMSKMVPISYGTNFIIILAAFCEMQLYLDLLLKYTFYIVSGIINKMPWFICYRKMTPGYICLQPKDYRAHLENATTTYNSTLIVMRDTSIGVVNDKGKIIHKVVMSPVLHFKTLSEKLTEFEGYKDNEMLIYMVVLWILTCACYGQLFKKTMWTILNTLQWVLTFTFVWTLIHIMWEYLGAKSQKPIPQTYHKLYDITYDQLRGVDIDYIAESMVAPPIIHVLRGRSHEPVNPSIHGSAVVLSNALYYLLRGFTTSGLRFFCKSHFGTMVNFKIYNKYPWFILWPIYFSVYPLAGLFSLLFFLINFIVDFLTFIVLFYCTLDVLHCEWPKIKKWIYMIVIIGVSFIYSYFFNHIMKTNSYMITKSTATLIDCVVVFWLYPVGRLVDDVTFHYGSTPSSFRVLSLKITPLYYIIKTYGVHSAYYTLYKTGIHKFPSATDYWIFVGTWSLCPIIFVLGIICTIIKYLFIKKQTWATLFRPLPLWGPREHIQRQLRKQFDSRVYIKSQSSRYLSRHHVSKEEDKFYKIDLVYERAGRRSTVIHDTFKFDAEKKTL